MNRNYTYLKGNKFAEGNEPNKTAFKKGSIPWNKGTKGIMKSNVGNFKKGIKPHNYLPIGTENTRIDQNGTKRRYIKIKENTWIEYSKYIWLKSGRKIKKNYCLHHINLDSSDDRLENLLYVSRQEHPKLHNRWNTKNKKQVAERQV